MTVHKAEISSLTTLWLLPIVSVIVCAATGGIVAGALVNQTHALWTLILSYVLWGVGIPLAMFTLVMYYHRLTMHKLPPPAIIASSFLPLGPLGEGGYSIMKMGQVSLTIFSNTGTLTPSAGEIIYIFGFLTALMMWGFALAWLFWAIAAFGRSKSPFNMGWWGIIFASAVFTGSTIALGEEIPSRFFSVLSTVSFRWPSLFKESNLWLIHICQIFTVIIVLFWMVVSVQTIRGTISGAMFFSPVAAELDASKESSDSES
jgi:tellurite resistance protein TehA-like permease